MRKLVSLVVAVMALTAAVTGVASAATSVTYKGQGFTGDNLTTNRCAAPDNGGTGVTIQLGQQYMLWVLTGGPSSGTVTLTLPDGPHQMVKVGGTWKFVSSYFSKASLLALPARVSFSGVPGTNPQLVVSHGCNQVASHTSTVIHQAGGDDPAPLHMPLGSSVHDSASVTVDGGVAIPTGSTVKFDWYKSIDCTGTVADTATLAAAASVDPALPEGPLGAGDYSYKATFITPTDANVAGSAADCEPITIDKATLGVTTQLHGVNGAHNNVTNTHVALGSTLHDTATVTGGVSGFDLPTVTFERDSGSGFSSIDTDPAGETGFTAKSVESNPLHAGSYRYRATVASNANYIGATSGDDEELVTVDQAQLAITTTIHNANHGAITTAAVGDIVHDTATVTGGATDIDLPAVSFTYDGNAIVNGAGEAGVTANSEAQTVTATPSTHVFKASVASNSDYVGATSADEPLSVTQYFCSPGFWRTADLAAWPAGITPDSLFNDTVAAAGFYPTIAANPKLGYGTPNAPNPLGVLSQNPATFYGPEAGPFNLNPFNAVGAFLTNAAGFHNAGSTTENCPIDAHGNIKPTS
jgi:hypothetical protein